MAKKNPESNNEKLNRALRDKAVLGERSKLLQEQVEDFRNREQMSHHVTSELLERQRELTYMLHRASSVLHQLKDTNLALSAEFKHIVNELPPAKDGDLEQTIERVNELFNKTHELAEDIEDQIFARASKPEPARKPAKKQKAEPETEVPAPEIAPQVESVEARWMTETAPEPEAEVEPQWAYKAEPEPPMAVAEPEMIAEPEIEEEIAETVLEVQEQVIEPEIVPEPAVEIAEPVIAEIEPEPEPVQTIEFEYDLEPEAQDLEEDEIIELGEPQAATLEEEPVQALTDEERLREEQIEKLFRQIQPFELKPAPSDESTGQGFISRLFRRNKTAV